MKSYNPIYWQQIPSTITFLVGTLVVLSGIFGTFALTQYRMDKFEDAQRESNITINRLDRSVLVIATKLGIPEKDLQVKAPVQSSVTYQYVQNVSEPSASPRTEAAPEATAYPTPVPTPTPQADRGRQVIPPIPISPIIQRVIDRLPVALGNKEELWPK